MRVDLYTFVHKAQRFHLFHLSDAIGLADLNNPIEAEAISKQVLYLMDHLKDHAQNEHTYIHPLFQAVGSVGDHFDREHEELEKEIARIEKIVVQKHWNDLYSAYTRFLGIYLLHLNEEEAAQRDILWVNYEDKGLAAVFNRFKMERPPLLAKDDFEFMLPALSMPELVGMFRGMKANAPSVVFQGACDTAARILGESKWRKLQSNISK